MLHRGLLAFAFTGLLCLRALAATVGGADPVEGLLDDGHVKKARAIVEQRLKANPNDAKNAFYWSRIQFAFDHQEAARQFAEKAVELDGQVPEYHIHLARVYGWLTEDAPMLKQYALVKGLKRELDVAQSLNPKQLDALLVRAVFLSVAPAVVGGDKKQADALVNEMISINPERGYLGRARIAVKVKDHARAESAFRKALDIDSQSYMAAVGLADLYSGPWAASKAGDAERYAKMAIHMDSTRGAGYAALARSYAAQQKWADLEKTLAEAEKNVPEDLSAYFAAAERLQEDGRELARAEGYLKKYLSQEREGDAPARFQALYVLALTYEAEGKRSEATSELQAALKLRPEWEVAKKELKKIR